MWNRRDEEQDGTPITSTGEHKTTPPAPARSFDSPAPSQSSTTSSTPPASQVNRTPRGTIGKSICIRGELTGNEDLTIEGKVEGKIELLDHNLTIGSTGTIEAEVSAKKVIVDGEVTGNISAGEKVELTAGGRVKGDIAAPRVVIADGAQFKGMVDMSESKSSTAKPSITSFSTGKKPDSDSKTTDKPAVKTA